MTAARASEFELIARHFAPLAGGRRIDAHGLKDDAASMAARPGFDIVMTADAVVRGIHFLPTDPPDLVARKALRVNLSDLAAKGARPLCYLLCLALPKEIDEEWIAGFAQGLAADQLEFGIELAGGDTTSTPGDLMIAITALGEVPAGRMLRRGAGRIGDEVWVSGTIGDGALGLIAAQGDLGAAAAADIAALTDRYRLPRPRTGLGPCLVEFDVAAMDVSDGLVQDLGHMCRLAGCGAEIEASRIPLSAAAAAQVAREPALMARAVSGGDDYEILVAVAPAASTAMADAARRCGTPMTRIGRLVAGEGVMVRAADGGPLDVGRGGWMHF
ncbi:MAG: thiamine-phosphate kinase [Alphaproteobacteria bacterium]|nr:thiamine-phosphate kinase [Alphaproteobacteria bacterium]